LTIPFEVVEIFFNNTSVGAPMWNLWKRCS
jgi:hypothetical protein